LVIDMKNSYDPGEEINLLVSLYDQAGELIEGSYDLEIFDGWNKVLDEKHSLNNRVKLTLPKHAEPGTRKVKVNSFGLGDSFEFKVNEVKKLEVELQGDNLIVKNIGNSFFDDELEIVGNSITRYKKLNLDIGDSRKFDLGTLFEDGTYNIKIPFTDEEFNGVKVVNEGGVFSSFGEGIVSVTGGATANVKRTIDSFWFLFILGLIALFFVLIMVNGKTRRKVMNSIKYKEYREGKKRREELMNRPKKKYKKYDFGKPTPEDVEDYKGRITKMFEERDKRKERREYMYGTNREPRKYNKDSSENSGNSGLFNMFK